MRPIHLKVKGFTAFRDEQELDFRELDLFALAGPTGSGKSSVLDAITYALYGKAERVEGVRDVSLTELISHGQRRMAVTLEFEVGDEHLRVTRSTPRSGASKVRLEKDEGGGWQSYGEGADRVRDVNAYIERLIGLDYDAFTRSVILPQGKFAEFLTGDPSQRRRILIELLGLELFGRMQSHAGQIAREAQLSIETTEQILAEQFAGVSADALETAKRRARDAGALADEAGVIEKAITGFVRRAEGMERATIAMTRCSVAAGELADDFASHELALRELIGSLASIDEQIESCKVDLEKAVDALEGATADLTRGEKELGTRDSLIALTTTLDSLDTARSESASATTRTAETAAALAHATADLTDAERVAAADAERAKETRAAFESKQRELERARRRDLIAAAAEGLRIGDDCPICGGTIATLPEVERHALEAAKGALERAEKAAARADASATKSDKALALARLSVEGASEAAQLSEKEAERRRAAVTGLEDAAGSAFGGRVPADARAQVERRVSDLEGLIEAAGAARERRAEAEKVLAERERARDLSGANVDAIRAGMRAARIDALMKDAVEALPGLRVDTSHIDFDGDPSGLETAARETSAVLASLRDGLREGAGGQQKDLASLRAQALERLPADNRPETHDIDAIAAAARELRNARRDEAVRLTTEAERLAEQLEQKRTLEKSVADKKARRDLYTRLAAELRTDRIVDFLQAEALTTLAGNGSLHLEDLSDHRYRLGFENDRFFVIDAWNADERRSVRTLSGGETFLASLALALALAEGVQMLAVTQKSRLESLFLDEGFGTLDDETLKAVVDALERLGSSDRLVGVITHVAALADEMPVRVEVSKSQRGSTLQITTRDPGAPI